jgi:hypothetical protein
LNDITDLHVRYLEQQLAQQQAVGQSLYRQGFADGRRHSKLEIPQEFVSALRHGSAHEHVRMPLLDGQVTIVLARAGLGRADEPAEAAAWEALERVRLDIREQVLGGVRFVQRRQLPDSIAAVIWRRQDRFAVVTNTKTRTRPRLRAALRSARPTWVVVLVIGWGIVRRASRAVVHMLAPSATIAAVSAAAVTVIATTPPTASAPAEGERGRIVQGDAHPDPLGPPLAYTRPDHSTAPETETPAPAPAAETELPPVVPPVTEPAPPVLPPPPAVPTPTSTPTPPSAETGSTAPEPPTPPAPVTTPTDPPTILDQPDPDATDPAATADPEPTEAEPTPTRDASSPDACAPRDPLGCIPAS